MKLTTKLLLTFSITIVLVVYIGVLAWNTAAKFDRQKNVLAYGDNIIVGVLSTDKTALAAISTNNLDLFKEVKKPFRKFTKTVIICWKSLISK